MAWRVPRESQPSRGAQRETRRALAGPSQRDRPNVIDPFDPDALAVRLAEARERRAVALANRGAPTAARAPAVERLCPVQASVFRQDKPSVGPAAQREHMASGLPASWRNADAERRTAPAPRSSSARMLVLPVAFLLLCIVALAAFRVLAPLSVRREVAEFIAPDLRVRPGAAGPPGELQATETTAPAKRPIASVSAGLGGIGRPAPPSRHGGGVLRKATGPRTATT